MQTSSPAGGNGRLPSISDVQVSLLIRCATVLERSIVGGNIDLNGFRPPCHSRILEKKLGGVP
jgi:hypothetical protein